MFETELKSLGLSDKEILVYLALIELGPSTMLQISKKSGVNRATTYVAVESLINKGLVSSFEKGKKSFVTAEDPERLRSLFAIRKKELEEQERRFDSLLPQLKGLMPMGERPRVRFYEGKEGVQAIQEDIIKTQAKTLDEIASFDEAYELFPPNPKDHRGKVKSKFMMRVIYTYSKGPIEPGDAKSIQQKWLPRDKFPFRSDILVCGDEKVILINLKHKVFGVIIESRELADSFRSLFNLVWNNI